MSVTRKSASPTVRERKERRKRFRAALALAGLNAKDFAALPDVRVTPAHLSQTLHGHRVSATLLQKVDAFIAKHLEPASALAS